jgi:hypothetical protein
MKRHRATLALVLAAALAACASPQGRDRTGAPPTGAGGADAQEEGPSAPPPAPPAAPGDAERVDAAAVPPEPPRQGFFGRLAKRLGSDRSTPNVGPCPAVRVLYDASRFVELTGPERFENVGFTGEIENLRASCRYVGADPISVQLSLNMGFGRGPRAEGLSKDVTYWVAVTRKDVAPIARERFVQRVVFRPGQNRQRLSTPVTEIVIPRKNKDVSGSNFEVFVGFELTDAQLAFNRDGKRFRVDSGPRD